MTVSVRPWPEIAADLRNFDAPTYDMSVVRREAADAGDALAAEVARLSGADDCEVCGSTSPAVRNVMPDEVGRRLFPDDPDVHTMACYWSQYHDPQAALALFADEECDRERSALAAVVAAVHTALDQWEDRLGGYAGCRECVADVAKACGR